MPFNNNSMAKAKPSGSNAPIHAHFALFVSRHMVRIVVEQGLCNSEKSMRQGIL
jgi:hypothetical protein